MPARLRSSPSCAYRCEMIMLFYFLPFMMAMALKMLKSILVMEFAVRHYVEVLYPYGLPQPFLQSAKGERR